MKEADAASKDTRYCEPHLKGALMHAKPILAAGMIVAVCLAAGATAAPVLRDMPQSYLISPAGKLTPLRAHSTYQGSLFPIRVQITPPVSGWAGAQWKAGTDYFRGGGPPNFGWFHVGHGTGIPQGLVSIMTAYTHTPTVAATVNVLRTRGRGATYEPSTPVTLAGFSGVKFDGTITGPKNFDHIGHYFIPFSAKSNAAKYYPDEYPVYGDVFRVIVLGVRGKTVVIYIENVGLAPDRFPGFLAQTERILQSLKFPG
jgi:hypothetical protein